MTQREWMPLDLVRWTTDFFARHEIASPRLDAELLLAHVLDVSRLDLYLRFEEPVDEGARGRYRELVKLRAHERMPVAYLTGVREFWSKPLCVTTDTLIPRPETETLIRVIAELAPRRLADVGTGCGAIAIALALELPESEVVAVDVSPPAVEIARHNLERLGLLDRVDARVGDGARGLTGPFDVIASNPPYIPTADLDSLQPEVRREPRLALDGGEDGLAFFGRLLEEAVPLLRPGGHLVVEVGDGQAPRVERMFEVAGLCAVESRKDLAGTERVVMGRAGEPATGGA